METEIKIEQQLTDGKTAKLFDLTPYAQSIPNVLELIWNDISNVPVADANSVSDWNTLFDLPTFGNPFESVGVSGNIVNLYGGSGITLKTELLYQNTNIISIVDNGLCAIGVDELAVSNCSAFLHLLLYGTTRVGANAMRSLTQIQEINLMACLNLGPTVDEDGVFVGTTGLTITLTVPSALMTCNGGNPDGDIQYLIDNNTITIIEV